MASIFFAFNVTLLKWLRSGDEYLWHGFKLDYYLTVANIGACVFCKEVIVQLWY